MGSPLFSVVVTTALGLALVTAESPQASAAPMPVNRLDSTLASAVMAPTKVEFRRQGGGFHNRSRFGFGHARGGRFVDHGYDHRRFGGGGVAAGVIGGLAAGAILGGVLGAQQGEATAEVPAEAGDGEAYCVQRFRSYDPASGTYLGFDGQRHGCP